MEKIPVQNGIRFLSVMAALLLGGALARADDFDGSWIMNANGWKFTLKLEQKGDVVTGTMTGINNDQKSTIEGKIVGNEIDSSPVWARGRTTAASCSRKIHPKRRSNRPWPEPPKPAT